MLAILITDICCVCLFLAMDGEDVWLQWYWLGDTCARWAGSHAAVHPSWTECSQIALETVWGNPSQNIEKALHYHYQFRAATVLFLVVAISERPQQSVCSAGCHGSNKKLNCTFCFQYSGNSVSGLVQFIGVRPHCSCAGRTHLSVRHWNERLYSFEEKLGREISFPQCYLLETIGVTPREIKF